MTSISGSMSSMSMMSPNDRMKLALQSAVSAGSVKSTDQTALSGALDDIDTAMKSAMSSGSSSSSTSSSSSSTDPSAMKTKISSLIDQEVTDGKLTDDQAAELKQVFADAAPQTGGPGGAEGMGGPQGAGGPPPPPPPGDASSDDSDSDSSSSSSSTSTSATASTDDTKKSIDTLIAFLQKLEQSMSSSSTYGSTGSSTASISKSSSLLIDSDA